MRCGIAVTAAALTGLAVAAPAQHAVDPDLVFSDDFESGNLSQWDIQACDTGAVISQDVARDGKNSVKFVVADDDTHAKCPAVPTENPRAQLVSPGLFKDGDEFFISLSMNFPQGFPQPTSWFQLAELYGPPFGGSPTMGLDVCNGTQICFSRDEAHQFDQIWRSQPIVPGQWRDIILHVGFSTDEAKGFVEIFDGGQPQQLSNGQTRINYATLNPAVNYDGTPNSVFINQYRSSDEKLGIVTLYHDAVRVGRTLQSVQLPPPAAANNKPHGSKKHGSKHGGNHN